MSKELKEMSKIKYDTVLYTLQTLTKLSITQTMLAEILGYSVQTINKRAVRNSYFVPAEIEILEKHFNVDLSKISTLENKDETIEDCITFPVLGEVEASMGYGVTVYAEKQTSTYSLGMQLVKDLGVSVDHSEIIFGRGNSMEPSIFGGDALLIDKSKKEVDDGRIYCIRFEGQLMTKRLQKLAKTKIKIISDNKDYEPIIIDFEQDKDLDFEVIGEVRWSGRIFR